MPGSRPLPCLYVAGDVHLHGDDSGFARFLAALSRRPPARLVILGDLVDYWVDTDATVARHAALFARLRALRDAGWRLDLVLGNRELVSGRMLAAASRCRIRWPSLDLAVGGRVLRIVHGDRLCYDPGYRFYSAWMRSFWWRTAQACTPAWVQDGVARCLRRASQRGHRQRSHAAAADRRKRPAVFIDRRRVQGAARRGQLLIAGHIHQSWRRVIGGVDLILVGDWPEDRGHWLEVTAQGAVRRCRGRFPAGPPGANRPG